MYGKHLPLNVAPDRFLLDEAEGGEALGASVDPGETNEVNSIKPYSRAT